MMIIIAPKPSHFIIPDLWGQLFGRNGGKADYYYCYYWFLRSCYFDGGTAYRVILLVLDNLSFDLRFPYIPSITYYHQNPRYPQFFYQKILNRHYFFWIFVVVFESKLSIWYLEDGFYCWSWGGRYCRIRFWYCLNGGSFLVGFLWLC